MGDVEHSYALAHATVFLDDTGILHRHLKPCKRHHLPAGLHMPVKKSSAFQ
jgi:hypothetical protein